MFFSLSLLLASGNFAQTQTAPSSDQGLSSTAQPVLRIERLQPGEAVCALVQEDGAYRLEKLFRSKAEMYVGKASNDQAEDLNRILGNTQLRKLSQENVGGDVVSDTLDTVDVALWRQRGWQTLSFRNPSSRKPFNHELDPLLQWFQNIQKKRPAAIKVEGAATRCLPPKELQSRTQQVAESGLTAATGHSQATYLFRFQSSKFAQGVFERTCTVVFLDGTYRREKRFQPFMGSKTDRSYGGQINADSLAELRRVLDSPDLKNAVSDTGSEQLAQNLEDFQQLPQNLEDSTVFIARENGIQHLVFISEFNTHENPENWGWMSNMSYHVSDQKAIAPLKRWIKEHTDKSEGGTEKDTPINDCFPTKGP